MSQEVYRLENIAKRYGEREVCRIDHLEVRRGEVLGIMGPSGAGKTTLLRLMSFLEPPSQGSIHFRGQVSNGAAPSLALRRRTAMVFQTPVLLSGNVQENVAYGLKVRGEHDISRRVSDILERVGLAPLAKANAKTLSGGEAQRVALARALVVEPEVLLLDEPTANLDPYNVALIEGIIASVNQERSTTVVMVTHNIFQARRLSHRVLFILEGQLVELGETHQVFTNPQDPRTAAFIRGEMVY